jgi:hypothetical protein
VSTRAELRDEPVGEERMQDGRERRHGVTVMATPWPSVSAGAGWSGDTATCPRCGRGLNTNGERSECECGLARPVPSWTAAGGAAVTAGATTPVPLRLPGRFNLGNAVMAMAAVSVLGTELGPAAAAMREPHQVAGRYAMMQHAGHEVWLLLAKNPAGLAETLGLLDEAKALVIVVNARQADARDTSWLWGRALRTTPIPPGNGQRLAQRTWDPVMRCLVALVGVLVALGGARLGHRGPGGGWGAAGGAGG